MRNLTLAGMILLSCVLPAQLPAHQQSEQNEQGSKAQSKTSSDSSDSKPAKSKDTQGKQTEGSVPDAVSEDAPSKELDATKTVKASVGLVKEIKDALAQEDPAWGLVLGIGSLVRSSTTDYKNDSNVLRSTGLGRTTPQLLAGVSFRTNIPNIIRHYNKVICKDDDTKCPYALYQRKPWSGFISLKYSPGSSQAIAGYVFGGSYSITRYLSALIGFSLTPVNEVAPGFIAAASQFVVAQQKQGQYLTFNADDMLNNRPHAFDGFPVADPTGRLLYQGSPTTVHYRGGVLFGVCIPIYFQSALR